MFPFKEEKISDNIFVREIPENVDEDSLIWHMDKEDRIIIPLIQNDWKFQFDNQLPIDFNERIEVKKGDFHRIIKGTGPLRFLLIKNTFEITT